MWKLSHRKVKQQAAWPRSWKMTYPTVFIHLLCALQAVTKWATIPPRPSCHDFQSYAFPLTTTVSLTVPHVNCLQKAEP